MQRKCRIEMFELHPHGQPLHDLDPVSGRVFGWQYRELRPGTRTHARHLALEGLARIAIDFYACRLTDAHVRELVFLEIRFDPCIADRHEREQRRRRVDITADLQLFDTRDDTVARRRYDGVRQIELGSVEQRLRLLHRRMPVRRDVRVAAQAGDDGADLLLRARNLGSCLVSGMRNALDLQLRGNARTEQSLLTFELMLL